jgi:hypothetical protein
MIMRARGPLLLLSAILLVALPAAADAWRRIPGARALARPGAARVTLELRASGGYGCGGGGCNGGVEARNVRGALPGTDLAYFYSDRPGAEPGCPATGREALFEEWMEAEIAPARGGEEERPACGIGVMVGATMQYWVISRVRRARSPS